MIRMYLIRHGSTPGNRERRYIGRTEEDLCEEGILALKGQEAPEVQRIYASPMRRCIQTAKILYPGRAQVRSKNSGNVISEALREKIIRI